MCEEKLPSIHAHVCIFIQTRFYGSFMGARHEIERDIPLKAPYSVLPPTTFPFKEACCHYFK